MFLLVCCFIAVAFSLGQDIPASYYCKPFVISEDRWKREYPSMYNFHGFLSFKGGFYVTDPSSLDLIKVGFVSGLWYQYFDADGIVWGETYIRGLPGLPPDLLVRASKNTLVPIPSSNRVCQEFSTDSNPAYVYDYPYSEVNPNGVGYSNSAYYYTRPDMLGRVGSGEMFSWDMDFETAFAVIASISQGNGHAEHNLSLLATFYYDKLSGLEEAMELGFVPHSAPFNGTRNIHVGKLGIPVEVLPANIRDKVKL